MFWIKLQKVIELLLTQIMKQNKLHESARRGIISLIPKKDRDPLYVKKWRPIILLNVDYKLFSKILASRLRNILDSIIHSDQTSFMSGRSITQNLRKIYDTISYVQKQKLDALIISIDFEKAFDRLEYKSLYSALLAFGVPIKFVQCVETLFTDLKLATLNGGFFSEWFIPTRGVFQGNCISPYAFVTVIEILAIKLRTNQKTEGIKINDVVNLLCQFAGDMQIFTMFSKDSLQEIISELSNFENISGMKTNYDKTAIYRIGSLKNSQAKLYVSREFKWTNEPLNILGLSVSNEDSVDHCDNIAEITDEAVNIMKTWYLRDLSLCGKIQILNALVASLYVYRLSVLPLLTKQMIVNINGAFNDFIWEGKKVKIKLSTISVPRSAGGLGLSNMVAKDKSLKLQWVYLLQKDLVIKALAYNLLGNTYGDMLWQFQFVIDDVKHILPNVHSKFWSDVLETWVQLNFSDPISGDQVCNEVIWNNSNIRVDGKPIYLSHWVKKGIVRIKDLMDTGDSLFSYQGFKRKYGLEMPFLEFYGIVNSIPKQWKRMLGEYIGPTYEELWNITIGCNRPVKIFYKQIFQEENTLLRYAYKWQENIDSDMDPDHLVKSIEKSWKMTNIPKLRSFHYRIVTNTLVTNTKLFYYKMRPDKMCSFCGKVEETKSHLFIHCEMIETLLSYIKSLVVIDNCNFAERNILLSEVHADPKHLINTVCLLYKYYVYVQQCLKKTPSVNGFKKYCENFVELEKIIATQNDKISLHIAKWNKLHL